MFTLRRMFLVTAFAAFLSLIGTRLYQFDTVRVIGYGLSRGFVLSTADKGEYLESIDGPLDNSYRWNTYPHSTEYEFGYFVGVLALCASIVFVCVLFVRLWIILGPDQKRIRRNRYD